MRRDMLAEATKYLVFAKSLNHYLIEDLEQCLIKINLSKEYEILNQFRKLHIYKKID